MPDEGNQKCYVNEKVKGEKDAYEEEEATEERVVASYIHHRPLAASIRTLIILCTFIGFNTFRLGGRLICLNV